MGHLCQCLNDLERGGEKEGLEGVCEKEEVRKRGLMRGGEKVRKRVYEREKDERVCVSVVVRRTCGSSVSVPR